jgi:hypothetical protein
MPRTPSSRSSSIVVVVAAAVVVTVVADTNPTYRQTNPLDTSAVSVWQCFVNPNGEVQQYISTKGYAQSLNRAAQANRKPWTGALMRAIPLGIW